MNVSRLENLLDFLSYERNLFEESFCQELLRNDISENEALVQGLENFDYLKKLVQDKINGLEEQM